MAGHTRTQWRDGTRCDHPTNEPCERCWAAQSRPIAAPLAVSFNETHYEHLFKIDEPVRPISSREELRQECIKRGVKSDYLENTSTFRGGPDRWI